MKALFLGIGFCVCIAGCVTLPSQPAKTAVYHTTEGDVVESAELNDFFDKMIIDKNVKSGEYYTDDKVIKWENE